MRFTINTKLTINIAKLLLPLNEIIINRALQLLLTQQKFPRSIPWKWYHFEYKFEFYMSDTPDLHLFQQLYELNGHMFVRYRLICDAILHSGRHRVLMVTALTSCNLTLRTVKHGHVFTITQKNQYFIFIRYSITYWNSIFNKNLLLFANR